MNKIAILSAVFAASSAFAGTVTLEGAAAQALFRTLPSETQEISRGKGFSLVIRRGENAVCRELVLMDFHHIDMVETVRYDCEVTTAN